LGKLLSVFSFAFDIGLRSENGKTIVKAVKLHKFGYDFSCKCRLRVLSEFFCKWVLPMERAFTLLNLILVVNCFEDA
jgi:hypothetical protein